jgi:hypothetical protein
MRSSELSSVDRISRRLNFVNNMDYWISESVYYRSNSLYFSDDDKIVLQSLNEDNSKTKIL